MELVSTIQLCGAVILNIRSWPHKMNLRGCEVINEEMKTSFSFHTLRSQILFFCEQINHFICYNPPI